jgi:hypothetical protein
MRLHVFFTRARRCPFRVNFYRFDEHRTMSGMPPKADLFRQNVWIAPSIGLFSLPIKTGILCQFRKSGHHRITGKKSAPTRETIILPASRSFDGTWSAQQPAPNNSYTHIQTESANAGQSMERRNFFSDQWREITQALTQGGATHKNDHQTIAGPGRL